MDSILIFDTYTGSKYYISQEKLNLLKKQMMDMEICFKKYLIEVELNKPFLKKLYELKGAV